MMYFKTSWIETRLMTNASTKQPIDLSILDDLWKPDIYIYNLKRIRTHRIFADMAGKIMYTNFIPLLNIFYLKMKGLWIEGNKLIYNIEVIATIYCPMQFDNYPMDKQHCPFQVGSFSHNGSYMTFHLDKYFDMNESRIIQFYEGLKLIDYPS